MNVQALKRIIAIGNQKERPMEEVHEAHTLCREIVQSLEEGYPITEDDLLSLTVHERACLMMGFLNYAQQRQAAAVFNSLDLNDLESAHRAQTILGDILGTCGLKMDGFSTEIIERREGEE